MELVLADKLGPKKAQKCQEKYGEWKPYFWKDGKRIRWIGRGVKEEIQEKWTESLFYLLPIIEILKIGENLIKLVVLGLEFPKT